MPNDDVTASGSVLVDKTDEVTLERLEVSLDDRHTVEIRCPEDVIAGSVLRGITVKVGDDTDEVVFPAPVEMVDGRMVRVNPSTGSTAVSDRPTEG